MYAKCPKCGSDKTHSSRVRPGERTTSTLFMKPIRCRQCKERFWVQNRSAYVAAAAMLGALGLFLGLVWLVVMHATRNQDIPLPVAVDPTEDVRAANANVPEVRPASSANSGGEAVTLKPTQDTTAKASPDALKQAEDRSITVDWYRENAEKGDIDAQYKLGLLHLTGKGALQDFTEAARWLKLAAEQGHPVAQYHLGMIYRVGHGVQTNQVEAYKWLNLAAAAGVSQAVLVRNEVMRQLGAEQLAQAQKASREWQANRSKAKPDAGATATPAPGTSPVSAQGQAKLTQ